jgi:peptidoglycan biosynthesis protein MviN/MurJ (putative lipid II flippase)
VAGALASIVIVLFSAAEQNLTLAAYGLVAGAAVEMVLGFAGLLAMGQRFRPDWPPATQLRRMAKVVGLPLLGQGVFIAGSTAERAIASYLGPGVVTAVTYSNRIFQMLERFVFRGFVIATIQSYTAGDKPHWRRDTRILLLLSIPLMIVFSVIPAAIITIIFERGRFTAEATQLVSLALSTYAFAIPIVAFNRIPFALAFAQNKSRELLAYSCIFAASLVTSELLLISLGIGIPAFGIAQIFANIIATFWLYRRIMVGLDTPHWSRNEVMRLVGVALLAYVLTSLLVMVINRLIAPPLAVWVTFIAGGAGALLFTGGAARLFRLPETERLAHLLRGAWR